MVENKLGSKIEGEEYLVLHEFAKKAKAKLSKETWDYLIGAAETETTFKRNRFGMILIQCFAIQFIVILKRKLSNVFL